MGDLKNYRELVYLIKTIDLTGKSDYIKSEKLLNKAIGELMILTPQQITLILRELNIIYENIQTFAKNYWRPDKFDLSNEFFVILYKRFLDECFFIEWNDNDNQLKLDLETMHHIVWKVKENSVLLVKLKQSITPDKYDDNTDKLTFTPETDLLKEWILSDYLSTFTAIEHELFKRGYIDNSYKWKETKIKLTDFLCVIISYKYFKIIVKSKKIHDFHKRQFISDRYGIGKTGITQTWKKAKPKIDIAKITYSWIEKPK